MPLKADEGDRGMMIEQETDPQERRRWADRLSAHTWWAALLVGGVLCAVALALS